MYIRQGRVKDVELEEFESSGAEKQLSCRDKLKVVRCL